VREILESSGVFSSRPMLSKYPISSERKYISGASERRPYCAHAVWPCVSGQPCQSRFVKMSCTICQTMLHILLKAESSSHSLVSANSTYQRLSVLLLGGAQQRGVDSDEDAREHILLSQPSLYDRLQRTL
jgi:hypothetical protein